MDKKRSIRYDVANSLALSLAIMSVLLTIIGALAIILGFHSTTPDDDLVGLLVGIPILVVGIILGLCAFALNARVRKMK
jgi:hypothetical protein